jgi:hypothetical protein
VGKGGACEKCVPAHVSSNCSNKQKSGLCGTLVLVGVSMGMKRVGAGDTLIASGTSLSPRV